MKKQYLYAAIKKEKIAIIKLLLTHKSIDINAINIIIKDDNKNSFDKKKIALYEDVCIGNIQIIKLLLDNKEIDVNIINIITVWTTNGPSYRLFWIDEQTALFLAVKKRNIEAVKLLMTNSRINLYIKNRRIKTYKYYSGQSDYDKYNDYSVSFKIKIIFFFNEI